LCKPIRLNIPVKKAEPFRPLHALRKVRFCYFVSLLTLRRLHRKSTTDVVAIVIAGPTLLRHISYWFRNHLHQLPYSCLEVFGRVPSMAGSHGKTASISRRRPAAAAWRQHMCKLAAVYVLRHGHVTFLMTSYGGTS
jgi:hypothetical protein